MMAPLHRAHDAALMGPPGLYGCWDDWIEGPDRHPWQEWRLIMAKALLLARLNEPNPIPKSYPEAWSGVQGDDDAVRPYPIDPTAAALGLNVESRSRGKKAVVGGGVDRG